MRILISFFFTVSLLFAAAPVGAEIAREARCASIKEQAAGRFVACMLRADAKFERNGERGQRIRKKIRCREALDSSYSRVEGNFGGACTTRGDATEVISDLEGVTDDVTAWIQTNEGNGPVEPRIVCGAGTSLDSGSNACLWNGLLAPDPCGNGIIEEEEECDFGSLGGATCESLGFGPGTLTCGAGCQLDASACPDPEHVGPRFTINDDGTVTDHVLNVQWDAKYDTRNVQHRDMLFLQRNLDRIFLFTMNREGSCYADHCDWRIPTEAELSSLAGGGSLCSESGLPVELCRENEMLLYWSSTTPGTGQWNGVSVPGGAITMLGSEDLARAIAVRDLDDTGAYGSAARAFLHAPSSLMD